MAEINNKITVSVMMLAYNHGEYIAQALDSILMQDVDFRYEIVVGEDCSADGTRKVLLEYQSHYPDIIKLLLHEHNIGMFYNQQRTLNACTGKYVAVLEGDDFWTDCTKLRKQVDFLEHHPDYVITYTDSQPFDANGPVDVDFGGARRDITALELKHGIALYTLTICFRNVLDIVPDELMQVRLGDMVVHSLLGDHGKGKYLADIKPAAYRIHDNGVHSKKTIRQKAEMSLITSNALYAYYTRTGDLEAAAYFHGFSLRRSVQVLGWFGVIAALIRPLYERVMRCSR